MKIPKDEFRKYRAINDLLAEFYMLKEKVQFRNIYSEKLQALLQNSTRKSVGCEAKFPLNSEAQEKGHNVNDGYSHKHWVLTREGIKEEFGYTGEFKCRKPSFSIWWADYVESKIATANLIKLIGHKEVRCDSALKEHIQMRRDMLKLRIEDGEYFAKIELPVALDVQCSVEDGVQDDGETEDAPKFSTKTLVFKIGGGWNETEIALVDGAVKRRAATNYQEAGWEYDEFDNLGNKLSFVQFLRYSEPEVYDVLMKVLREQIVEVQKYITKTTAEVEAVIAKYGHYLVFNEL